MSQGVIGLCMAGAAFTGLLATFAFPPMRKKFGLRWTGISSFTFQNTCLLCSILSIFAPGSPFQPDFIINIWTFDDKCRNNLLINRTANCSEQSPGTTMPWNTSSMTSLWLLMAAIIASRIGDKLMNNNNNLLYE